MVRNFFLLLLLTFSTFVTIAQYKLEWERSYVGSNNNFYGNNDANIFLDENENLYIFYDNGYYTNIKKINKFGLTEWETDSVLMDLAIDKNYGCNSIKKQNNLLWFLDGFGINHINVTNGQVTHIGMQCSSFNLDTKGNAYCGYQNTITKIDSNGTVLFSKIPVSDNNTCNHSDIYLDCNQIIDKYFYLGTHQDCDTVGFPYYDAFYTSFSKYDTAGNLIWDKKNISSSFYGITTCHDKFDNTHWLLYNTYNTYSKFDSSGLPNFSVAHNSSNALFFVGFFNDTTPICHAADNNTGNNHTLRNFDNTGHFTNRFIPQENLIFYDIFNIENKAYFIEKYVGGRAKDIKIVNEQLVAIDSIPLSEFFVTNNNHISIVSSNYLYYLYSTIDTINSITNYFLRKYCKNCSNNLTGVTFTDKNNNCQYDIVDKGNKYRLVKLSPLNQYYYTADSSQFYFTIADSGQYSLKEILPSYYDHICYDSVLFTFSPNDTSIKTVNLESYFENTYNDIEVVLSGSSTVIGYESYLFLLVKNNGTKDYSGQIKIIKDSLIDNIIPINFTIDSIVGDTLFYTFIDTLHALEQKELHFKFITPVIPDFLADSLVFKASIVINDNNNLNNNAVYYSTIRGSYDPNDKSVSYSGLNEKGEITDSTKFIYRINFQNTGNDSARFIKIFDAIDSKLNIETFHLISTSHPCNVKFIDSKAIIFHFDNIYLPDSNVNEPLSHGYILFEIYPQKGTTYGDTIKNKADIYFDYNPKIETNTVYTIFTKKKTTYKPLLLSTETTILPNPFSCTVTITLSNNSFFRNVKIYNILGDLIISNEYKETLKSSEIIDLNYLTSGFYTITIETSNNEKISRKIIKQ